MNPADEREVDFEEGSFFRSLPPDPFKPSEFGHLPQHWYSHVMHGLEVVAYQHPNAETRKVAFHLYYEMVDNLHLNIETEVDMMNRLSEDRIVTGTVVS